MTEDEISQVMRCVSAVLLFGNLKLKASRNNETCTFDSANDSPGILNRIAKLCGIDGRQLETSFLSPKLKVVATTVKKSQNQGQVKYAVESISKAIYERLFAYLVKKINKAMKENNHSSAINFIGILDIAGFEIFEDNSFEQLCINLTNEKLQQLFNHTLFIKEQEEYIKEGIEWNQIDFGMDLEETIALIEGRPTLSGLIPLLDQACLFPSADDKYYQELCIKEHKKTDIFISPSAINDKFSFGVIHYAGEVLYNAEGWLKKNMDQLNDNVTNLLGGSKIAIYRELFSDAKAVSNRRRTMAIQQQSNFGGARSKNKGMK